MKPECRHVDLWWDSRLGQGDSRFTQELAAHVAACPRCHALYRAVPQSPVEMSAARKEGIRRELFSSLAAVRPLPGRIRSTLQIAGVLSLLGLAFGTVLGGAGIGAMSVAQVTTHAVLAVIGFLWIGWALSSLMRPGSAPGPASPVLLAVFPMAIVAVLGVVFPWRFDSLALGSGMQCLKGGTLIATPVVLAVTWMARRGVVLSWVRMAAAIGVAGGTVGMLVMQSHCLRQDAGHVVVWHGAIIAASGAAGLLIGRRVAT